MAHWNTKNLFAMPAVVQLKKPIAPPVYRPLPAPRCLQPMMKTGPAISRNLAPLQKPIKPPTAPAVYRPTVQKIVQPKLANIDRRPPIAPPVYRPELKKIVQPKMSAITRKQPQAPPVYRPDIKKIAQPKKTLPTSLARPNAIQRIIHQGKTTRSKPYEKIKLSKWYKELPNDDYRAFALQLHSDNDNDYTDVTAYATISQKILNGEPVPTFDQKLKDTRKKRVREYVNENAPDTTDISYEQGNVLTLTGEHAYLRMRKKRKRNHEHKDMVNTINNVKPNLFDDQETVFEDFDTWQQIFALTNSTPQSYDFNIDGSKITLDSKDIKSHKKRKEQYTKTNINLAQVFIKQPEDEDSYWKISDSKNEKLWKNTEHQQLRFLEIERENKSVFTTLGKDYLYQQGYMTTTEAFGDENLFAFQEFKGALSPTNNMLKLQTASSYQVLQKAMKHAEKRFGIKVGDDFPQTTPKKINDALNTFMANKTKSNYRKLVKEIYRMIRSITEQELSSESEEDSVFEYSNFEKEKKKK